MVEYNSIPSVAGLATNTSADFNFELFQLHEGILIAEPFQTVQELHMEIQALSLHFDLSPIDPEFQSMIGAGPIEFPEFSFRTGFDTFRLPSGSPVGFSVFRERWEARLRYTYEYTIVPSAGTTVPLLAVLLLGRQARRRPL